MGNKNRIHLDFIIDFILHFHRNFFIKNKIYMSKRVEEKIKLKHNEVHKYTIRKNFEKLMNHTIGSCEYIKSSDTLNFIAYIQNENKFILYSLKAEKHHCICSTIFSLNEKTLKSYYNNHSFVLFNKKIKHDIEEYIN